MIIPIQYKYSDVGAALFTTLYQHIRNGESFVLLGYQGCGKRQIFTGLNHRLSDDGLAYLTVWFRDHSEIVSAADLIDALHKRIKGFASDEMIAALRGTRSLSEWFRRLGELSRGSRLPFFFANIDSLATSIKLQFLSLIREAVMQSHIVACLSGDNVLARTLGQSTSPFECAYQYVVTGHDKETAREFFMKRVKYCQLVFCDAEDPSWNAEQAFDGLYEHTGSNLNLLRAILWWLSERRLRFDEDPEKHPGYPRSVVKHSFYDYNAVPLFGLRVFHSVVALIQQERAALAQVSALLDQIHIARTLGDGFSSAWRKAKVAAPENQLDMLELAGFLRRDPDRKSLRFASFYVADFAFHYFVWRRIGDFHCEQGDWAQAFEAYDRVKPKQRLQRPLGEHDYQKVRSVVNRFCRDCAAMIMRERAITEMQAMWAQCTRLLFGLEAAPIIRLEDDGTWKKEPGRHELSKTLNRSLQSLLNSDPVPSTRIGEDPIYSLHQDQDQHFLLVQNRPATPEIKPRHAVLLYAGADGAPIAGLRLRLLETMATTFLTCYNEARLRRRTSTSRLRLGNLVKTLFQYETIRESIDALGSYLNEEFLATGVRLFLIDKTTGHFRSEKSWGIKDSATRHDFDSGKGEFSTAEYPELWRSLEKKAPTAFRWCPEGVPIPEVTTDLTFEPVRTDAYAERVERKPGDYWIDFPLFVKDQPYGKLTFAFSAYVPPPARFVDDFATISEILTQHFERLEFDAVRFAKLRSMQNRAVSITAHDLATRISSLPVFLADYKDLEDELSGNALFELRRINQGFRERLESAMKTLETAKLRLRQVRPVYADVDIVKVIRGALESIDAERGGSRTEIVGQESGGDSVIINADKENLEGVFLELVSNSISMGLPTRNLEVVVRIERLRAEGKIRIDYADNGPGVPNEYKERIFEYFLSYRPGQVRKGLGLGLGYVFETISAHHGSVQEIGQHGVGAHFEIIIPVDPPKL